MVGYADSSIDDKYSNSRTRECNNANSCAAIFNFMVVQFMTLVKKIPISNK